MNATSAYDAGCAKGAGLELKALEKCYKGKEGQELDDKARKETDALDPPHTFVPWVRLLTARLSRKYQRREGGMGPGF